MTSQDRATLILLDWQAQRRAGIPPEQRKLPGFYCSKCWRKPCICHDQYAREIEATREEMREPRF